MLYRTSMRTLFQSINTNLSRLTWEMTDLNNQVATGKRVNKPSDDPSGGAVILAMRSVLADVKQYNKDVALADDWLKQSEAIMQNMKNVLERANVLAEQMSTDTYRDENLLTAADEVRGLMEALVKAGNTRIEDRYIFAGHLTETRPFAEELTIHNPLPLSGNSTSYTGSILSPPPNLRSYQPLPGVPEQSKVFMIEVTTAGGVGGSSLATGLIDPAGDHNAVEFTALDVPAWAGAAGNAIRVEYVDPGAASQPLTITVAGNDISVSLATDGAGNIISTADDVIAAINADPAASLMVTASLAPGNSGNGIVADTGGFSNLSGGVTGTAMFRVSEDGGKTWGPADAYLASTLTTNIWNTDLGHAALNTNLIGNDNDLQFVALAPGTAGNGIQIEYVHPGAGYGPPTDITVTDDRITVNLETDAAGNIVATAQDVMNAINAHPTASQMVTASLTDPDGGGTGLVTEMGLTSLSGGWDEVAALGHATLNVPTSDVLQNLEFTAVAHGVAGNAVGVELLDPGLPSQPLAINVVGNDISVSLATDANGEVTTTAQELINAFRNDPAANALVTVGLTEYQRGGDAVLAPMAMTRLSGGDASLTGDQNVQVFFSDDGSALQVGDRFEIEVSYYMGDDQDLMVNANRDTRTKMNLTGEEILGEAGSGDNILDTLARLEFALRNADKEKVAEELPALDVALEKVTTQMAHIGVRLTRNQFTYNVLDNTKLSSTDRMSRIEDLDIADAVTALQAKQIAYQAVLASTALITKLSLVDYIS